MRGTQLYQLNKGGESYVIGFVEGAEFANHAKIQYLIPSSAPGTPRIPSLELVRPSYTSSTLSTLTNRAYVGGDDDYVFYLTSDTNLQQTNISAGTTVNYSFPGMLGPGSVPTGGPIGGAYTNGTTAAASDGVNDIFFQTGGVITTVNYASATEIRTAGWDGEYYWFCVTGSTFTKAVKVHDTTGTHTVDDITGTFPAHSYNYRVCRARYGYMTIWAGNHIGHTAGSSIGMWVYDGTSAVIYNTIDSTSSINHSCFNRTTSTFPLAAVGVVNLSLSMTDIDEDGYMYWTYADTSGTGYPCTGFQKLNLDTGVMTLYNNIFPVSLLSSGNLSPYGAYIGALGGGNVVIASSVDKGLLTGPTGSGQMQIFFLTDGVTTTMVQSDGPEGHDANAHAALCCGDSSGVGYVYYSLAFLQDYIVGTEL